MRDDANTLADIRTEDGDYLIQTITKPRSYKNVLIHSIYPMVSDEPDRGSNHSFQQEISGRIFQK